MTGAANQGAAPAAPVALAEQIEAWRWAMTICRRVLVHRVSNQITTEADAERWNRHLAAVGATLAALPDWQRLVLEVGAVVLTPEEQALFAALGPAPAALAAE